MRAHNIFTPEWSVWHLIRCLREKSFREIKSYTSLDYTKTVFEKNVTYTVVDTGTAHTDEILDGTYTYIFKFHADNVEGAYLLCRMGKGEGEILVNGKLVGSVDYMHKEIYLGDICEADEIEIHITKNYQQASENYRLADVDPEKIIVEKIALCQKYENTNRLFYLGNTLFEAAKAYGRKEMYDVLKKHIYKLDEYLPCEKMDEECEKIYPQLLSEAQQLEPFEDARTWLTSAHSHLDLMFHWAERDSIRKIGRTFSNTISFLDRFEDNIYTQSQMRIFAWCEEYYPELFKRLVALANEGKLATVGDWWCEPDTNIPYTECFIRQCLYGRKYAREKFGDNSRTAYLPDTFGFNPVLPQVLKEFGYEYFVTSKLAWNDTNPFPYNEFVWEGIDGTIINSYQLPGYYSGQLDPHCTREAADRISSNSHVDKHIYHFAAGDGGGGVNEEMVQTKAIMNELGIMDTFEDCTVDDALDVIFTQASGQEQKVRPNLDKENTNEQNNIDEVSYGEASKNKIAKIQGELYLQKHRGTYTNYCAIKKGNRETEIILRNAEAINAIYGVGKQGKIEELFKELLVCQFHDTIAGTIVDSAYEDVKDYYANIKKETEEILYIGKNKAVLNNTDQTRDMLITVRVNNETIDELVNCQLIKDNSNGSSWILIMVLQMKPFESRMLPESILEVADNNIFPEKVIDQTKADFGHEIKCYFDRGGYFDSWDINKDYRDYDITDEGRDDIEDNEYYAFVEDGPFRTTYVRKMKYAWGLVEQYMCKYNFSDRTDFFTSVEMTKMHCLVKAEFPTDADEKTANFDIGYGYSTRNITQENIEKNGMFEVPHQKWLMVGSTAILNDCKYGCDVIEGHAGLTLVKTSDYPGTAVDMGINEMVYSVLRSDNVRKIVDEAENLNQPYCVFETNEIVKSPITGCSGGKLAWMKQAEDGNATVIRIYECEGNESTVEIEVSKDVKTVCISDMSENNIKNLEIMGGKVTIELGKFEIVTLKVEC